MHEGRHREGRESENLPHLCLQVDISHVFGEDFFHSERQSKQSRKGGREGETLDLHVDISRFGGRFFSLRPITIQSRCRAGEREREG